MTKSTTPTARERELYQYYQPFESRDPEDSSKHVARSSNDLCLKAFAQLGALRMNAKRGLITLSSKDTEYILAESGKTLSLQSDDDEKDRLWHGIGVLKGDMGLGPELVKTFCESNIAPACLVVNDLTQHDAFKNKCVVIGDPFVKFLTAVPLRTPFHSMIIGNYIVVDDKPRDGLSEDEMQFMLDMGVTVMDYLEAGRIGQKEYRAQRMVKAVGLFIQGKASLRDWWLQEGYKEQKSKMKKRIQKGVPLDVQADAEFGVQDAPDDYAKGIGSLMDQNHRQSLGRLERSPSSSTVSNLDRGDGRPPIPHTISSSTDNTIPHSTLSRPTLINRNSSVTTLSTLEDAAQGSDVKHFSVAFDNPSDPTGLDDSKELQEAVLSSDLKSIFSRASNLIREARGMDGTLFFDASVGSFGGSSKKDVMEQKAPGSFQVDAGISTSDDDQGLKTSDTDTSISGKVAEESEEKNCNILGYSTRKRSSLRGHTPHEEHLKFPESILRSLLKRYPHGKVFNFDADGSCTSSDETDSGKAKLEDDSGPQRFATPEKKTHKRRTSREAEAAAILNVLPGARSVFFFPLWDHSRDRWYAGTLVWSTCPTRSLCPQEDLTYLAAFGNSIIAEVARLSAQVLAQMKNDFISSISHELRSPLHGVLASVEFLQETNMTDVQVEMVNNIHASGKVLLDTINHVLDFSKVNRREKKGRSGRKARKSSKKLKANQESVGDATEDVADVCILSEEVIESIYAGRNISKLVMDASAGRRRASINPDISSKSQVAVIMDIKWRPSWISDIDAGAWRRILMNLFSNAMKYTRNGFVKVSLHLEKDDSSRRQQSTSMLVLQVEDSGKGISQEFLKNHLYKPFTQEDSLATGAGLGLSIVRHIVHDLGGQIEFTSEQGTGTEATVHIPLALPNIPDQINGFDIVSEVRKKTEGLQFCLNGFDKYPDISETPTGILSAEAKTAMHLKSSIQNLMTGWFAMDLTTNLASDIVVIMESDVESMEAKIQPYIDNASDSRKVVVIILCNGIPGPKIWAKDFLEVIYLQQPYGPHKMAKLLHNAFYQSNTNTASSPPGIKFNVTPALKSEPLQPTTNGSRFPDASKSLKFQDFAGFSMLRKVPTQPKSTSESNNFTAIPENSEINQKEENLRVLLVEDNAINLKLLVAYMRKLNLPHSTACNGLEALNTYKSAHPHKPFNVIFMDISMPVMSGIESTKHIRRFERDEDMPPCMVIALTGAANPEARQEAFGSGVDLFLTKPVPMRDLKVMLEAIRKDGREGLVG